MSLPGKLSSPDIPTCLVGQRVKIKPCRSILIELLFISDHGFYCAKLKISNILVLDFFGGAKTVEVKDYFDANPY